MRSERDVEAKFLPNLFCETLGYRTDDLKYDVPASFNQGTEEITKRVDLVIYLENKPVIVVEAKRPTSSIKLFTPQVDSYAFAIGVKYSVITNSKSLILRGYYEGNKRINIVELDVDTLKKDDWKQIKSIISAHNISNTLKEKPNLITNVPSEQILSYKDFFEELHNVIRNKEKVDPTSAFDELSKLLFIKVAEFQDGIDLLDPDSIELTDNPIKKKTETENIQAVFTNIISQKFPDVFDSNEQIKLTNETVKILLKKLKNFSLKDDNQDIKGRAFEAFLPSQLRGKGLGQYFTPRPIVDFMVKMANVSMYDIVVDFSCGSGGFLIKAFESILNTINQVPDTMWARIGTTKKDFLELVKSDHLYGIDAEQRAVRLAKMNMILWGDGKSIVRGNGLHTKDKLGREYAIKEYTETDKNSGCTLILANPPFGSKEEDADILARYKLGEDGKKKSKKKSKETEILFIERGIKLLRPEGRMLIIVPEGIVSNPSYQYVRDFIMKNADIRAIISLPTHTFVQSGVNTIKTVILYLEKFTKEKKQKVDELLNDSNILEVFTANKELSYKVFMGIAEDIGYEPSGNKISNTGKTDLDLILEDFENQRESNSIIDILEFANKKYLNKTYIKGSKGNKISRGVKTNDHVSYYIDIDKIIDRFDPTYYFFQSNASSIMKSFVKLGNELIKEAQSIIIKKKTIDKKEVYRLLSCTINGLELDNQSITKDIISDQKYKIVEEGDIVYNPYRINIGSIGVVGKEMAGSLVSGAYVIFRCNNINPFFLCALLKTPFYKLYINLTTTGSIRDHLSYALLQDIYVQNLTLEEQTQIINNISEYQDKILKLQTKIIEQENKIMSTMQSNLVKK